MIQVHKNESRGDCTSPEVKQANMRRFFTELLLLLPRPELKIRIEKMRANSNDAASLVNVNTPARVIIKLFSERT